MKPSLKAAVLAPLLLAPLLLAGCADADNFITHGAFGEARGRAVNARQYSADMKACDGGAGAEWCKLAAGDGRMSREFPLDQKPLPKGVTYAYDASQCQGTFAHGLCQGVSRPQAAAMPVCHGETIDGVCAGPVY
ncbi:MAG TPA: hypothetical protein VGM25_17200 [Caulobacteraceae bacterium]|jgi:hypothetical protein